MEPAESHDLVQRLRRGEADAFDEVFDRWRAPIFGFLARASGRRDLAEDLVQETFLRLATGAPSLAEDTTIGPWLYTVARRLLISHGRQATVDAGRVRRAAEQESPRVPTPYDQASAGQTHDRLERALAQLPESHREALLLVATAQLEPAEAAQVLGITAEAFRQRLSRARALLRTVLEEGRPRLAVVRRIS